jgi:hypothetical protein
MDNGTKQTRSFEGFSDHDLLVRIATLQEIQTTDIQGLRNDNARLWADKAAQSDLVLLRATVETLRAHKAEATMSLDQERRLRAVERWMFLGMGGLFVLDIGFPLLVKFLWH